MSPKKNIADKEIIVYGHHHTLKLIPIDDKQLDESIELENAIEHVMNELDMNREEAMETIQEIHLMEVQQTVDSMMKKGLLEITGYNENDEPLYTLTELGKSLQSPDA